MNHGATIGIAVLVAVLLSTVVVASGAANALGDLFASDVSTERRSAVLEAANAAPRSAAPVASAERAEEYDSLVRANSRLQDGVAELRATVRALQTQLDQLRADRPVVDAPAVTEDAEVDLEALTNAVVERVRREIPVTPQGTFDENVERVIAGIEERAAVAQRQERIDRSATRLARVRETAGGMAERSMGFMRRVLDIDDSMVEGVQAEVEKSIIAGAELRHQALVEDWDDQRVQQETVALAQSTAASMQAQGITEEDADRIENFLTQAGRGRDRGR